MDDRDIALAPDSGTSPLAEKLQRIADYERGYRKTIPWVFRALGRTRAYGAVYRRYAPEADTRKYRKTQGRSALRGGLPLLLLTTTGAKSGLPRVLPLTYMRDGDDFVVTGTNFGQRHRPGPAWAARRGRRGAGLAGGDARDPCHGRLLVTSGRAGGSWL